MNRILVLGACGQIGSELTMELRKRYGNNSVVATGHRTKPSEKLHDSGPFEFADILDRESVERVITKHGVDTIYNMAAILSARGEQNPQLAFRVNVLGLYNVLELGREHNLERIMVPSSIAAFGPSTPKVNTPNETLMRPTTMYGVSKVTGELLGNYYFQKYGLDVRGVRYPGIISSDTLPGGGTTDYAVEIYYEALRKKSYTCYLREDTVLPLMYMPDAIEGIIKLAEADISKLKRHCDYNINSMSLSVGELAASIKKFIPEFVCEYKPNFRQTIADSWPKSLDDSAAREEWGWQPQYSLEAMTKDMLTKLSRKLNRG
jgi:nucleoside-diphosphate-sugar epimerase